MIAGVLHAQRARVGAACVAALLLSLTAGCGDSEPEPAPTPSPAARPGKPARMPAVTKRTPREISPEEIAEQQRGVERGEGTVPDGFPEDLPLPASAQPTRWMQAAGPGSIVAFETDLPPDQVFAHFEKSLPGAGWTVGEKKIDKNHWALTASKDGRKVRISIAPGGAGSELVVAVAGH